jgi:DNA-binding response OmpR family regulator
VRILYVEDNRLLATSTARSLTAARFTVDVFNNPAAPRKLPQNRPRTPNYVENAPYAERGTFLSF